MKVKMYKFDDLSEAAKKEAYEQAYSAAMQDLDVVFPEYCDYVIDYIKETGAILGITIDKVYFSGFGSRVDGSCFEGRYEFAKGCQQNIRKRRPADETLHKIADDLVALQRKWFYGLTAVVRQSGRYYHKYCTDIRIDWIRPDGVSGWIPENEEEPLSEVLRDFMDWSYRTLEKEYEYLSSEESIMDVIRENGYEFTENGELF